MKKILIVLSMLFAFAGGEAQTINTVAGSGTLGFSGDGGPATAGTLQYPQDVVRDAAGNLYIVDRNNNRIRKVNTSGVISTIAGTGTSGYTGDGGPATAAQINTHGIAVDGSGNIYIAEYSRNVIRKIDASGIISTFAGTGTFGFSGDGGPATAALLGSTIGVAVDASGNVFFSEYNNNRIRRVNTSGIISTVAGNGSAVSSGDGGPATAAGFNPRNIAFDGTGNLYIADANNNRIRKVDVAGIISTFAGNGTAGYGGDGGAATAAMLSFPWGVAVDASGNVYIGDRDNHRVRKVSSGTISTIAGTGTAGYSGDGGAASAAQLNSPMGITLAPGGTMHVAERGNHCIREINGATIAIAPILGTATLCVGATTILTNATPGGTWSSSVTSVATVGSATGIVAGVAAGTAVIIYTVGSSSVTRTVTVMALPSAAISGATSVCATLTVTLTGTPAGGIWTSLFPAIATIGSSTGIVTGVTVGIDTVKYKVTNSCGSDSVKRYITVVSGGSCTTKTKGKGKKESSYVEAAMNDLKIYPNPNSGVFIMEIPETFADISISVTDIMGRVIITRSVNGNTGVPIDFDLGNIPPGMYLVKMSVEGNSWVMKLIVK